MSEHLAGRSISRSSYVNAGCRCDLCRAAHVRWVKEWRLRKLEQARANESTRAGALSGPTRGSGARIERAAERLTPLGGSDLSSDHAEKRLV